LARTILIRHWAALGHLHGRGVQRELGDPGVTLDQDHVIQHNEVLPGNILMALGRQIAFLGVVDGEMSPTIDRHVEHPIHPAQGLTEFGVVKDGDGDPR